MENQLQKSLLLPQPDYSSEGNRRNHGLGINQPAAVHTMRPLFDLGLIHAVIAWRHDYKMKQPLRMNRHTFNLLLDGQMTLEIDGTAHTLAPGDLAYYPAGAMIDQWNPGNSWFLYLTFNHRPFWDPLQRRGTHVRPYESADLMYLLMERIACAHDDPTTIALQLAKRQAQMLADLLRHEINRATYRPPRHEVALKQLVEEIRQDSAACWTLRSMAEKACVSPRTLNRLFVAEYGVAPIDLVVRERMAHAHDMILETDMKIATIAEAVGYESVPSFSRLFKKHFGKSPGQCRSVL